MRGGVLTHLPLSPRSSPRSLLQSHGPYRRLGKLALTYALQAVFAYNAISTIAALSPHHLSPRKCRVPNTFVFSPAITRSRRPLYCSARFFTFLNPLLQVEHLDEETSYGDGGADIILERSAPPPYLEAAHFFVRLLSLLHHYTSSLPSCTLPVCATQCFDPNHIRLALAPPRPL